MSRHRAPRHNVGALAESRTLAAAQDHPQERQAAHGISPDGVDEFRRRCAEEGIAPVSDRPGVCPRDQTERELWAPGSYVCESCVDAALHIQLLIRAEESGRQEPILEGLRSQCTAGVDQ